MNRLFSRAALLVAVGYAVLVGVLLMAVRRGTDPEGASFNLLFVGFPWVLVLRRDSFYFVALALNVARVYILVLSVLRIFSRNSN
jgi:hypothetical protein